ncbi:MAG: electron transfer flavoprotein subunit beta/FixA family protein [Smithellaceae bacterium]|nr:electron transfer flavoprotein subunit beta/FixA family protein [Smithellaceae bacterium]
MRIYVCVKHVPDTAANIRPEGQAAFDEKVKYIINPYDEYALEEALRIREQTGDAEVVALTVGRETAQATLRSALAMGADRGILVRTEEYFVDSALTARLLKGAMEREGSPDLVFTGKQSVDTEGMQTPYRLAALLDMPLVVDVVSFSLDGGKARVERESEAGMREILELTLPGVIGAAKGLNRPRCPTLPDVMKAKKKELKILTPADLMVPAGGPLMDVIALTAVPDRARGKVLCDSPEAMVAELIHLLREEAKVLT